MFFPLASVPLPGVPTVDCYPFLVTFNFILGKVIIMPRTIDPLDHHLEFGIGVPVVFVILVVSIMFFIVAAGQS